MLTYALLGATGATGSSILRHLLSHPPEHFTLNILVRSRSKLLNAFPDVENTAAFKINIFEGTPSDSATVQECLKDVDVVMGCIGSNESTPGMSLVYDTAAAIINALGAHKQVQGPAYKIPTVIQLRTTSLNPIFKPTFPWVARTVVFFCLHYIYEDLDRGCNLLAAQGPDASGLLNYIFVDPPSIHDADGTTPTGYNLILEGKQNPELSYADLGVAFCEVAKRRDEFAGKGVAVSATGAVNQTWGTLVGYMMTGVKGRVWG